MKKEWIIRGVISIVSYAWGARGKDAARQRAASEGLKVGIQLGGAVTNKVYENGLKDYDISKRRW